MQLLLQLIVCYQRVASFQVVKKLASDTARQLSSRVPLDTTASDMPHASSSNPDGAAEALSAGAGQQPAPKKRKVLVLPRFVAAAAAAANPATLSRQRSPAAAKPDAAALATARPPQHAVPCVAAAAGAASSEKPTAAAGGGAIGAAQAQAISRGKRKLAVMATARVAASAGQAAPEEVPIAGVTMEQPPGQADPPRPSAAANGELLTATTMQLPATTRWADAAMKRQRPEAAVPAVAKPHAAAVEQQTEELQPAATKPPAMKRPQRLPAVLTSTLPALKDLCKGGDTLSAAAVFGKLPRMQRPQLQPPALLGTQATQDVIAPLLPASVGQPADATGRENGCSFSLGFLRTPAEQRAITRLLGPEGGAESKCALAVRQVLMPAVVQPCTAELLAQSGTSCDQGALAGVQPSLSDWSQVKVFNTHDFPLPTNILQRLCSYS